MQPGQRNPRPEDEVPFALEAGDVDPNAPADSPFGAEPAGMVILCDLPAAELIFTGRCSNPVRWSSLFAGALAWRLAIDSALYLTKKAEMAGKASEQFQRALDQARLHQAIQGKADAPATPDFLEGFEQAQPFYKTSIP